MAGEHSLHDLALHADPSTVDQSNLDESPGLSGVEILRDDGRHVARREGVQIQRILDRDADGLVGYSRGPPSTCSSANLLCKSVILQPTKSRNQARPPWCAPEMC